MHYHASVNQKIDVYQAWTTATAIVTTTASRSVAEYEQGTLVIDMVDTKTNKVVWRGWAQDSMTGIIDTRIGLKAQVEESVTKMMLRLPTGGAALR